MLKTIKILEEYVSKFVLDVFYVIDLHFGLYLLHLLYLKIKNLYTDYIVNDEIKYTFLYLTTFIAAFMFPICFVTASEESIMNFCMILSSMRVSNWEPLWTSFLVYMVVDLIHATYCFIKGDFDQKYKSYFETAH